MSMLTWHFIICSFWDLHRYEEAKDKSVHNFERELEDVIERLILECDRKIHRALKRLEDDDAKAAIAISVSKVTNVIKFFFYIYFMCPYIDLVFR